VSRQSIAAYVSIKWTSFKLGTYTSAYQLVLHYSCNKEIINKDIKNLDFSYKKTGFHNLEQLSPIWKHLALLQCVF